MSEVSRLPTQSDVLANRDPLHAGRATYARGLAALNLGLQRGCARYQPGMVALNVLLTGQPGLPDDTRDKRIERIEGAPTRSHHTRCVFYGTSASSATIRPSS